MSSQTPRHAVPSSDAGAMLPIGHTRQLLPLAEDGDTRANGPRIALHRAVNESPWK